MNNTPCSYREYEALVIQWAKDRQIIPYSRPHTQLMKAVSEMGELVDAEMKDHLPGIEDGVGDVLVCLINYCKLRDIDMVRCLANAYDEIKDRKGHMTPDGTFVKEA